MEARVLRLESEVYRLRADAESESRDFRTRAEADLRRVRSEFESEVRRLRAEVDALKFRKELTSPIETACFAVLLFIVCFEFGALIAGAAAA